MLVALEAQRRRPPRGQREQRAFGGPAPAVADGGADRHLAASAELELAEQDGDADRALATYDPVVEPCSPRPGASCSRPGCGWRPLTLGVLGTAAAEQTAAERAARRDPAADLLADGDGSSSSTPSRPGLRPRGTGLDPAAGGRAPALALAGQVDPPRGRAGRAWRADRAAFEAYGHVHELARARARLAAVLRATGDTAGARWRPTWRRAPPTRSVRAAARRAHRAGLGHGAAPPRPPTSADPARARDPRARRRGAHNGEIGKQLFISTKTVSVHVSNILGKLGAASRTEAAALARRRGLLP